MADRPIVSASQIQTHTECPARVYHECQRYHTGLVETEQIASKVSSSIHNALMAVQQRLTDFYIKGRVPQLAEVQRRLRRFLDIEFMRLRVDVMASEAIERLAKLDAGLDAAAALLLDGITSWSLDPSRNELLVWAEQKLDHGQSIPAVRLAPGYLVRTRPDIIGLKRRPDAPSRIVVRDFKAKGEPVDPAFDIGILVRGLWALIEAQDPRCPWFLAGRLIDIDVTGIDLETVNLMFAGTDQFVLRASLTAAQLEVQRGRMMRLIDDVAETLAAPSADEVYTRPSGLCRSSCPFVGYCEAGKAHVRDSYGSEVLDLRLAAC